MIVNAISITHKQGLKHAAWEIFWNSATIQTGRNVPSQTDKSKDGYFLCLSTAELQTEVKKDAYSL